MSENEQPDVVEEQRSSDEAAAGTMTPEEMRAAAAASVGQATAAIADLVASGRTEPHENTLLEVQDLKMYFPVTAGLLLKRKVADIKAVDGISFAVREGETLGLVGESGCGKSTTGRAILQLYRPTAGQVFMSEPRYTSHIGVEENGAAESDEELIPEVAQGDAVDLTTLSGRNLRAYRRQMQMIFQDPYASLNPRMSVGSIVSEPMVIHGLQKGRRKERVRELLETVGLNPTSPAAIRTSSQAVSASASALPAHSRWSPRSSSATSRCRRLTCRFRLRSSTCLKTCSPTSVSRICSLLTTSRWCVTSRTASRSCTWARSWSWPNRTASMRIRCIHIRRR